jgi:UDP-3-O-[3-hydroxymyristoyl] N-acetylglucosamine deacetylase
VQQTTIARPVRWRGIGLHSGLPAAVEVLPAAVDTGLVFVVPGEGTEAEVAIPAYADAVQSTTRATTLAASARRVATVEHLLAALFALGIHNARIEVRGGEIPVLDGSAALFVSRLRRAGLRTLSGSRRELEVTRELEITDGDRRIRIAPGEGLRIDYSIDFAHPSVGRQRHVLASLDPDVFEAELAPARTFGFVGEVDALRAKGLARGGDYSNTLVLGDDGLLTPGGLRFPDEFVRHKLVDLLGDLALVGAGIHAQITVVKGGHGLHHALVRALVEQPGLVVERAVRPVGHAPRAASALDGLKAQPA